MRSIFLLTVEWAYQPRSSGWRENLGTRLWAYNWGGGYKIQFKVFRYFAPCWSTHGLKLLIFSSFRSTPAPVSGQSSLKIVG